MLYKLFVDEKVLPGGSGELIKGYAADPNRTIYSKWDPRHIGWMDGLPIMTSTV